MFPFFDTGMEIEHTPSLDGNVLLNVLDFLSVEDIIASSIVCKLWNKVSKDERLWKGERGT